MQIVVRDTVNEYHCNYFHRQINKKRCHFLFNSFLQAATCLLVAFANSLDPDQDRQNVGPDLDSNC